MLCTIQQGPGRGPRAGVPPGGFGEGSRTHRVGGLAHGLGVVKYSSQVQRQSGVDLIICSKIYLVRTGQRQLFMRVMSGMNGWNPVLTLTFT